MATPEDRVAKRMDKGESFHEATKKVAKTKRQKRHLRRITEDSICND